jgi:hypothetical protein
MPKVNLAGMNVEALMNLRDQVDKRLILKTLVVATAIAFVTVPAFANSLCFERHYNAAHLGKHPDQLVTSMTLALDPDGPVARARDVKISPGVTAVQIRPFDFKIAMTKRGNNSLYVQQGSVEIRDGKYRGMVECDGGGFILRKVPSGVLLSIGLGAGYLQSIRMAVVPGPCGDNSEYIERGKDDDTFRLNAVSTQVCSRLFDKIDWNAVVTD